MADSPKVAAAKELAKGDYIVAPDDWIKGGGPRPSKSIARQRLTTTTQYHVEGQGRKLGPFVHQRRAEAAQRNAERAWKRGGRKGKRPELTATPPTNAGDLGSAASALGVRPDPPIV